MPSHLLAFELVSDFERKQLYENFLTIFKTKFDYFLWWCVVTGTVTDWICCIVINDHNRRSTLVSHGSRNLLQRRPGGRPISLHVAQKRPASR